MGILDKLFGDDDPLEEELKSKVGKNITKENKNKDNEGPPMNILYGKKCWPYKFKKNSVKKLAGRELLTYDENNNPYMGKDIRDMIENRKYKPEDPTRLGYTKDNIKGVQDVFIDHDALFKHIALFGRTGYGKSTLMKNIMLQWINAGYGVCFVDPKGEDSYDLMRQLPPHRLDDVLWVEPGNNSREKAVGFNVFETYNDSDDPKYEQEVNSVASDFVQILEDRTDNWGPQISNITETIVKQVVRTEDDFNPIDMVKIMTDEEERKYFAENYGDELEQIFLQRIAKQDDEAFDAVLRRVRNWVEDRNTRQIMAHNDSNASIQKAVEEGKIIIVNTSNIEKNDTKEIIIRVIISRLWSAIKKRSNIDEENREPYFLCIDEFDKVISNDFDINEIISLARAFKLSVFVANQQPSQLSDDVQQALQQVQSLISFNPGNKMADAQMIAHVLGDVESYELNDLEQFTVVGKPSMNGKQQEAMVINTFADYPPLRSKKAAEKIIDQSLEKYGSKPDIDTKLEEYGAKRFINEDDNNGYELNDEGDEITEEQLLECVYTAQLKTQNEQKTIDGKDDWVTVDQVKEEIKKYGEPKFGLQNVFEKFTDRELERKLKGGEAYFRLGNEGLRRAFEQDTGKAASGGKSAHRMLLRRGYKSFTKLGYKVRLPDQDGSRAPDGLATPPIQPMKECDKFEDAVEKEIELVKRYPRLAELFGDEKISIEAESTTISRPAQTIKNLTKAIESDKKCVFLVKDGSENKDNFAYWAKAGERILTDPPFVRNMSKNGCRRFYTTNEKVKLSNGARALVPKDSGQVVWKEKQTKNTNNDNKRLILTGTDSDEPFAVFKNMREIKNKPAARKFPYHYYRDKQAKETVVKNNEGKIVERYENLDALRKDDRFKTVNKPLIPKFLFPDGKFPSENEWIFVIIPDDEDIGPHIYDNGELEPLLLEHGGLIDENRFDLKIDIDIKEYVNEEYLLKGIKPNYNKKVQEKIQQNKKKEKDLEDKSNKNALEPFDSGKSSTENNIEHNNNNNDEDNSKDNSKDNGKNNDNTESNDTSNINKHKFPDPP